MEEYQVWHRAGETYKHVADVAAGDAQTAVLKTQHGLLAARWQDAAGITAMAGEHRSTELGDIILAPDGEESKFVAITVEGLRGPVPGFEPTQEVSRQLYAEWLDDAKQRNLHDWSVDFADRDSHALLGEIIDTLPKPELSDYQRSLQAAIGQAKHRADELDRGPML